MLPAGRQLDFSIAPGSVAHIYRRCHNQPWQCVAHNAHSPYLDDSALPEGAAPEYVIRYHDASGSVQGNTPVVQVHPVGMPAVPSWISL